MTLTRCSECGAEYTEGGDSCQARFDQLLALDHSHQEPWGSRHGLAFAAFALQHPRRFSPATIARAQELATRVCLGGEPLARVVAEFRAKPPTLAPDFAPAESAEFAVTIADLDIFDAPTYPEALLRWARAALRPRSHGAV